MRRISIIMPRLSSTTSAMELPATEPSEVPHAWGKSRSQRRRIASAFAFDVVEGGTSVALF
jgi:hypothetical protein